MSMSQANKIDMSQDNLNTFSLGPNHQNPIQDSPNIIQSIKEDIIDAVNDLKAKSDIWNLSDK